MATLPSYVKNAFATDSCSVGVYVPGTAFATPASGTIAAATNITSPAATITAGTVTTLTSTTANVTALNVGKVVYTNTSTNESEATITLSSAQLLALRATPIQIVAAPTAGNVILVNSCTYSYNYVTTAYGTTNVTLSLILGNPTNGTVGGTIAGTGLLDQTASSFTTIPTPNNTGVLVTANATAKALFIKNTGSAEALTGDGTLKVIVRYSVVTL